MNDRTFAASVLTPWFMAEHKETAERHLKEKALLEAAKELETGKKYVIDITVDNIERNDLNAIETRVKVNIQEPEIIPVAFGIDWAAEPKRHSRDRKLRRRRGWGSSKRTRSRKRLWK